MNQGGKFAVVFFLLISALGVLWIWIARQSNERAAWTPVKEKQIVPIISLTQPSILVSDPTQGPQNAPVTIVEFADFRCPHCVETAEELKKIMTDNPGKIRLVWKDFPIIPPREESVRVHEAARCAQIQGEFWEYHDELFAHQNTLTENQLLASAVTVGLNSEQFQLCFTNKITQSLVERSFAEGENLKIDGTPTLYVNGKKWNLPLTEITLLLK
ncbi:MAG: DsbA family protein [Candidatus Magasanikbacteria bacterium]|nr:DsbA family protein [Candidatus Magasanikbacteria bacterium]